MALKYVLMYFHFGSFWLAGWQIFLCRVRVVLHLEFSGSDPFCTPFLFSQSNIYARHTILPKTIPVVFQGISRLYLHWKNDRYNENPFLWPLWMTAAHAGRHVPRSRFHLRTRGRGYPREGDAADRLLILWRTVIFCLSSRNFSLRCY